MWDVGESPEGFPARGTEASELRGWDGNRAGRRVKPMSEVRRTKGGVQILKDAVWMEDLREGVAGGCEKAKKRLGRWISPGSELATRRGGEREKGCATSLTPARTSL